MARVAIFVDEPDWHTRRLKAAFAALGAEPVVVSLDDCAFALGRGGSGIFIPGFAGDLPDAAIVRAIATGSFEQVTLRLSLLHALEEAGVPVVNHARAIERSVDKAMTSFLLHRAGIPTPPTFASESDARAAEWRAANAEECVAKPLFGSQGRGLARLKPEEVLPPSESFAGVRYLQRFVGRDSGWRDFRVMVIGGEAVAAMLRHGRSWITNVRQGGRCETVPPTGRVAEFSIAAAKAVGVGYAGVDVIEDRDGKFFVLEVNSMPAWKGLQGVSSADIAGIMARYVLARAA